MGYESKLIVVNKSDKRYAMESMEVSGMYYAEKIAEFNLCKVPEFSGWMNEQPATEFYFYADDGNTEVIEDRYGNLLTEASLEDVIEKLKLCEETVDYYRRYRPVIQMLEGFNQSDWAGRLAVLHYGY